ncbi:acyl-CoA dehydrogenase family protein [Paracoccus sp. S1E-3]|uniref:acyl-CoA dehydrogenase family protein n=1 Tax=Paracoccus sp. S1E-3 TaxID=2756130 RepID=UPI0015EFA446|nr:acyl-CoA dehydrogenase family protein [Paracoccus sp. S1E-3]MBA4489604.1 acyl-CoA dehydrogenase family protein [Paracoccus sp. S1E-3]
MNFELSDEQRMLKDSLSRFLSDRYDFKARERVIREGGLDGAVWRGLGELGVFALPFPEEDGGLGGGPVEMMIVAEEMGRALVVEPWLAAIAEIAPLLVSADPAIRADLAARMADGSLRIAFAHREPQAEAERPATTFADGKLSGTKARVIHGAMADAFIVSASVDGGTGLFLVETADPGVTIRSQPTQDGRRMAEIHFDGAAARRLDQGDAETLIANAAAAALAATCAEAVGAMDAALWLTTDYLKTREQFGRPIGTFQGLQHQAADMFVALEQARSMAMYAAVMSERTGAERDAALSAAKVQINRSAKRIGQTAVQLHGGVGVTMEYAIGHYFKRLTMIELTHGDLDHHMDRLARLGGVPA